MLYLFPFPDRAFRVFRFGFGNKHTMAYAANTALVVFAYLAYLKAFIEFLFVLNIGNQIKQPVPPALYNIFYGNHI